MTDTIDFSLMEEKNEQTLSDIRNLQQIEQDLYNSLEINANNNTLTDDQKNKIIKKIYEISQMRINLYTNLKNTYAFIKNNVASSRITLDEQIIALDIVENELNQSKMRLQLLQDDKYNKLRQVEINTYYGKKYNSHSDVMKLIVLMCIPILLLTLINNTGIIPEIIYTALIILIISIGVICIGYKLIDNSNRDSMNYDEYDWGFNSKNAPSDDKGLIINPWENSLGLGCSENECCIEGESIYNAEKNKCVPSTMSHDSIKSSSFMSNIINSIGTESFSNRGNNYLQKLDYSYLH